MKDRKKRIQKLIREKIGEFLLVEEIVPQELLVSITRVDITGDLRSAKIYVTSLNRSDECLGELKKNAGQIKSYLGKELNFHYTPELSFFIEKND
ncbi:TPA: 30S ribosome-binding factor RbfA [bacterium]|nr:30S ribosome-binding factor RbfA [bacterium]